MRTTGQVRRDIEWVGIAFLFSGAAGLMYQVAWQRMLFAAFGIDLASVAIIVSAFMLGLGLGALAGGWVGDRWPNYTLTAFAICELGIGSFGLASPHALRSVASFFLDASFLTMGAATFVLMLIPTMLMGATLPILIAHLARIWGNVGGATGHLYAVNTFGAMLGALVTGFLLFNYVELDVVVYMASAINVSVACGVYFLLRRSR